ncbi:glycosyltransferase [Oenococcus oeni]
MIFVTVGTHEQPFDRLLKEIDKLIEEKVITEKVIIQTGFSKYVPKNANWRNFMSYDQMNQMIIGSHIVISHGGPASFLNVMSQGKTPIVVPRLSEFHEHVNDHQLIFVQQLIDRGYDIKLVNPIDNLGDTIKQYDKHAESYKSHNSQFMDSFENVVHDLF